MTYINVTTLESARSATMDWSYDRRVLTTSTLANP
jgi:hypothetical protein